jgi:hypothetical protein
MRLVQLADNVEAFHHSAGVEGALAVARERRGAQFDPVLVDCFLERHADVLADLDRIRAWDEVIALDPRLGAWLPEEALDRALQAFADFADLKSPHRLWHSRGVATLAAGGAARLGLSAGDVDLVRRAAWVHDIGMIGVPSAVWNATRPWSLAQGRAGPHSPVPDRPGQAARLGAGTFVVEQQVYTDDGTDGRLSASRWRALATALRAGRARPTSAWPVRTSDRAGPRPAP